MPNEKFDVPVTIDTDEASQLRIVNDTMQAAEILLRRWPMRERRCPMYLAAVKACLAAMEGRDHVVAARRAFVTAARAAHILVGTNIQPIATGQRR